MAEVVWQIEHSVEAKASPAVAWHFMTDVKNWDDPPAEFALEGPFASGTSGTTRIPGQNSLGWFIRDVQDGAFYAVEAELDRAVLRFEWRFEAVSDLRTLLTQRITLAGENAGIYVGPVEAGLGANLAAGMRRIADAMEKRQQQSGLPEAHKISKKLNAP